MHVWLLQSIGSWLVSLIDGANICLILIISSPMSRYRLTDSSLGWPFPWKYRFVYFDFMSFSTKFFFLGFYGSVGFSHSGVTSIRISGAFACNADDIEECVSCMIQSFPISRYYDFGCLCLQFSMHYSFLLISFWSKLVCFL